MVVGAGVVGCATALALARRGVRTLVLEQHKLGHALGSSHGRSRIFRLAHQDAGDVRDAALALERWRAVERDGGTRLLVRTGGLDFRARDHDRFARAMREADAALEILEPVEIEERFPSVRACGQTALFDPDAHVVLADEAVATLARLAVAGGAQLREGTRVTSLEPDDDGVTVGAGDWSLRAAAAVICAGPWAVGLAAQAGVELAATATLQTVAYYRLDAPRRATVPAVIDRVPTGQFYAVVEPDGSLKAGRHDLGPTLALDGGRPAEAADEEAIEAWIERRFVTRGTTRASHGCTFTSLPGEAFTIARNGPVVVASACSGRGFKFAPLSGDRAAALAADAVGTGRAAVFERP